MVIGTRTDGPFSAFAGRDGGEQPRGGFYGSRRRGVGLYAEVEPRVLAVSDPGQGGPLDAAAAGGRRGN